MAKTIDGQVREYFRERGWNCVPHGDAVRVIRSDRGSKLLHRMLPGLWKAEYFDQTGRGHPVCEGPDPITVYVQAEIQEWRPT